MWRRPAIFGTCLLAIGGLHALGERPRQVPPFVHYRESARSIEAGSTPRRPLPAGGLPDYYVDAEGLPGSRQGSAFAVNPNGDWATAAHVTDRCGSLHLLVGKKPSSTIPAVTRSASNDISIMVGGLRAPFGLSLAARAPRGGAMGYHMGFPMGSPGLIGSRYLGATRAIHRAGRSEPMFAWVEDWRSMDPNRPLDGISGGPVLDSQGDVVGIVSMVTDRRGRILTAWPAALKPLLTADRAGDEPRYKDAITDRQSATARFRLFLRGGVIRQVYCDS